MRDALEHGPIPLQGKSYVGRGRDDPKVRDEACLTLTVWSPDTAASLPVMVWIPGGAFVLGAGQFQLYNGARLAANGDVVVVNVTYRIGVFGGLELSSLGDGFDDNLALRDQIAALQWVRDNVSAFGGDPRRVTVFGESAGATSVLALLASPAADGLFGRAIAQSPALPLIADRELRARRAEEFVRELDVGVADIKGLPQRQLRLAAARLQERSAASTPTLAYGLTYGVDLLPRHPTDAARAGEITRLPLIVGTNSHEATMFAWSKPPMLPTTPALVDDYFRRVAPDAKDHVLAAYPGYPRRRAAIEVASDVMFGGTGLGVRGRVQRRRADVRVPLRPRGGEPAGAEARRHARQRDRARAPHLRLVSGPADPSARPADPARGGSAHATGVVGLRRRSRSAGDIRSSGTQRRLAPLRAAAAGDAGDQVDPRRRRRRPGPAPPRSMGKPALTLLASRPTGITAALSPPERRIPHASNARLPIAVT